MTRILIDAIVRQTVVLIAQLATSRGLRAPLARIAERVFQELSRELERQGVTRSVSADMFGMALRTYQRRTQRVEGSVTERGRSLWEAVFSHIREGGVVNREEIPQGGTLQLSTGTLSKHANRCFATDNVLAKIYGVLSKL